MNQKTKIFTNVTIKHKTKKVRITNVTIKHKAKNERITNVTTNQKKKALYKRSNQTQIKEGEAH